MTASNETGRPILVGYDGTEGSERALLAAIRLFHDAPILVATATGRELSIIGSPDRSAAEQVLQHGVQIARAHTAGAVDGVACTGGSPSSSLLSAARDADARAVVIGFRGHSTARSALMGSCSYGVAHRADRPTMIVPDRHPASTASSQPGAALVAVDATDVAPERFAHALRLIKAPSAVVLHVTQRHTGVHASDAKGRSLAYSEIRSQVSKLNEIARDEAAAIALEIADWLARETGRAATGEGAVTLGAAWLPIVERADHADTDVVIVGSRGHGIIDRVMLGSISNGVVHHAHKPVLVVP